MWEKREDPLMVRPFDAPSPKPAGNSINWNHDDESPTLGKKILLQ